MKVWIWRNKPNSVFGSLEALERTTETCGFKLKRIREGGVREYEKQTTNKYTGRPVYYLYSAKEVEITM